MHTGILVEKPEPKNHLEGSGVTKMNLIEIGLQGMDWINLAQHRDRWWAFVKTITNHRVPLGNQGRFCSIKTAIYMSMHINKMINGKIQVSPNTD
jgi:hypothetical protein